jgi:hypothetical protein
MNPTPIDDHLRMSGSDLSAGSPADSPSAFALSRINCFSFCPDLLFIPVQRAVIRINRQVAPGHDENVRLSRRNWAAMVVGNLILFVTIAHSPQTRHRQFDGPLRL